MHHGGVVEFVLEVVEVGDEEIIAFVDRFHDESAQVLGGQGFAGLMG